MLDVQRASCYQERMHTDTPEPRAESMAQAALLEVPPVEPPVTRRRETGPPRVLQAERSQVEWRPVALDALLPDDHRARAVWQYVEGLDLTPLYVPIRATESQAGRPATDPKILLALWLYATVDGVGSARALARLCEEHVAYQWLCGGVPMNHHTLADFRTAPVAYLDRLLTHSVAALMTEGLVELTRVAQDGMRVRANAGAASFRRRATLERCLTEAEVQVQTLRGELETDPAATSQRQRAAQARAARERAARVAEALAQLPALEAKKPATEKAQARASTTDPDARVMKMADGGFRPAYNIQLATDTTAQVIVGVDVNNVGSDRGQLAPMVEQVEARHQQPPGALLADGGFTALDDIDTVSARTLVYAPVPKPKDPTRDPYAPLPGDSAAVAAWRQRMGTAEAQAIYKERAATAECVNAQARNRGLLRLLVRGRAKVRAVALWYALAHNLVRTLALRTAPAAA
jgi:transposase